MGSAFLHYLAKCKVHICSPSAWIEATLTLRDYTYGDNVLKQSVEEQACKYLSCNTQKRYPPMVVAVFYITLIFVKVYNVCIFEVLGDHSFFPYSCEEFM